MQVREGMSEVVLTVGPSHTLREAAEKMLDKGTGAALVTVTHDRSVAARMGARIGILDGRLQESA